MLELKILESKKVLLVSLPFFLFINLAYTQGVSYEKGTLLKDSRDGQTYQTANYERKFPNGQGYSFTWMMENLNYEMENSFCYNDSISNCNVYGRIYTWDAAQSSCPQGWHIPTDEEWYMLAFLFGGNCQSGNELKSESLLWNDESRGTNKSLFSALPGGSGSVNGPYYGLGRMAIFWSSTERDEQSAWDWKLRNGSELQRWHGMKLLKNAVRCVQD